MTEFNEMTKIEKNGLYGTPNVNMTTGEILTTETIIQETEDYTIVKTQDGKFKKNMKYKKFYSKVPVTEEESIELYNVFNDENSDLVTPLKNMINKEITIQNIFTNPYQSFDENTGDVTNGVTTTLEDVDGNYYATSSKSVYFKVHNLMDVFNAPNTENYKPIKVKVTGTKQARGVQISLQLIGVA